MSQALTILPYPNCWERANLLFTFNRPLTSASASQTRAPVLANATVQPLTGQLLGAPRQELCLSTNSEKNRDNAYVFTKKICHIFFGLCEKASDLAYLTSHI